MLRVFGETGIEDLFYFFVAGEKFRNDTAVAIVLFHAGSKGLHSAQDKPAFERGKNRSGGLLNKG